MQVTVVEIEAILTAYPRWKSKGFVKKVSNNLSYKMGRISFLIFFLIARVWECFSYIKIKKQRRKKWKKGKGRKGKILSSNDAQYW